MFEHRRSSQIFLCISILFSITIHTVKEMLDFDWLVDAGYDGWGMTS